MMINKSYRDPDKGLNFMYPYYWDLDVDADIVSIYNSDGVGALQFSTYRHNNTKDINLKNELQTFLKNQQVDVQASLEKDYAKAIVFDNEGRCWKYWLFLKNGVLIFASYNCEKEDMIKEEKEINNILGSLN